MKVNRFKIKRILGSVWLLLFCLKAYCYNDTTDVWNVIRSEFKINHEVSQSEVQQQIHWLASHPSYIQKLARQSEPYIYHIITEIKKRNLPGELALIPMIESSYDPFAYSGAGAAGIWQLMPETGHDLGLKQDWWFDGRRSIRPSTEAALKYLEYLNNFFNGNWPLAIAAYDSGQGTIAKAIKNSGRSPNYVRFWQLSVPQETRDYVPRLLALAEIIKNPQRYHITLPNIPYLPYFEEVHVGSQIDLDHAAKLAGISYSEMIKLNPGHNRSATAPNQPLNLLIPRNKVELFSRNLAMIPKSLRVSFDKHIVESGDTLSRIAYRYHTTVNLLRQINDLHGNLVKPGQPILLPVKKQVESKIPPSTVVLKAKPVEKEPANKRMIHIVQPKDNYESLEKQYGVTAGQIRFWNKLHYGDQLKQGMQLVIIKPTQRPTLLQPKMITIKPGDTLSQIAKNHHTSIKQIFELNPGIQGQAIKPGQKIVVGTA